MDMFKIGDRVTATFQGGSIKTIVVGVDTEVVWGLKYIVRYPGGWENEPGFFYKEKYGMTDRSNRYSWICEKDLKFLCQDCYA